MTDYDLIRCRTCGHPFRDEQGREIHPQTCPRHEYRPFPGLTLPTLDPATVLTAMYRHAHAEVEPGANGATARGEGM